MCTDDSAPGPGPGKPEVPYDAFAALDLRTATVVAARRHPQADKLLLLDVDLGALGRRQIVAGIARHYEAEPLVGRSIIVVANLRPVRLRGEESRGMLLAASAGESVVLLTTLEPLPPGSPVS
ncbi:MAG: methionine--tRNA ligase subunit beta [Candidatus Eisenbacteria bacterium]|uniref:Methionine--tRNA ligase subunit beta n=1 Tax=Eiseniibacteriota bacterium TaxID=2212470 RepID=A0A937XAC6_UNCEI|nr:methionine--tRNA ligase subunit beta [Candidatus Eisenbacteria bacterium]